MFDLVLTAIPRKEIGKNANRRLRSRGQIPAVVYGKTTESMSVAVNPKEVVSILHLESGRNTVFKLKINEKQMDVLIRDLQVDPIRGTLLHADFQTISMDETRVFNVPIELVGDAEGVKEGGIVDIVVREIEVVCLPRDVPDHISIDIAHLNIGEAFRVRDLPSISGDFDISSNRDLVLVTVVPPKVEVEPEPAEEELEEGVPEEGEEAPDARQEAEEASE